MLWLEGVAIFVMVGVCVEYRFRGLKDDVSVLAGRYWTLSDRVKWCLTTLLGAGSVVGVAFLTAAIR